MASFTESQRWDRLGFPRIDGNGRLVIVAAIDSLGMGLFLPLSILYFVRVSDIPLSTVGVALSLASVIALAAGGVAGALIDRFGATAVICGVNLARAGGFISYVFVDSVVHLVLAATVVQWCNNAFWPANSTLIVDLCGRELRGRWFILGRTVRSIGLAVGTLLSGLVAATGSTLGLQGLCVAQAITFLLVAILIGGWRKARDAGGPRVAVKGIESAAGPAQEMSVWKDVRFAVLVGVNGLFAVANLALPMILPLAVVYAFDASPRLTGILLALNTVLIVLCQPLGVRIIESRSVASVLRYSGVVWAAAFLMFAVAGSTAFWAMIVLAVLATALFTFAEVLQGPAGTIAVSNMAPDDMLGRYMGANQLSWSAAYVVAPVLFTTLFDATPALPWAAVALMCLLAVAAIPLMGKRLAEHSSDATPRKV